MFDTILKPWQLWWNNTAKEWVKTLLGELIYSKLWAGPKPRFLSKRALKIRDGVKNLKFAKNQNCQLGFKWIYMIAKTLSFKMIPLMWLLLLQGTCYSLVCYCVSLWRNNTLVPPYKRQFLVPVNSFLCTKWT